MLKLTIITLILIGTVTAVSITGYKGSSKKFTLRHVANESDKSNKMPNRTARSASKVYTDRFPEELHYVINLEDLGDVELDLIRDRSVRVPRSFSRGKSGNDETRGLDTDNLAFYKETNGHGSFACQLKETETGESECMITALLDMGAENCYLSAGSDTLDCSSQDVGEEIVLETEVDATVTPGNGTALRQKREVKQPPQPGFRTIEVAYLPDNKFTELFVQRHQQNTAAAEVEMDLFFTLLTNEINVFFESVDDASGNSLQLQVYAATVIYPENCLQFDHAVMQANTDWSTNNIEGEYLVYGGSLESDIESLINDDAFTTVQFDFVLAITGYDLRDTVSGVEVVSRSHQSVLCTDSTQKYSVSEFTAYNLPRILVHELGHAAGALDEDDSTGSCPANVSIMSRNMFNPNSTTKDTYYKFSTCSGQKMRDHVLTQTSDCLVDDAFSYDNDYVPQFCTGYAGTQADYLNKQCERRTNTIGSTACDSVDDDTGCYRRDQIRCTTRTSSTSRFECSTAIRLQYVWNGTPCGPNNTTKFCFKGNCVDNFSLCSSTTTTTTTTTVAPPQTEPRTTNPCICCVFGGLFRYLKASCCSTYSSAACDDCCRLNK